MGRTDVITDLHCHILPGIDDGAADLTVTRALLEEELRQGVKQIMFTPHYYCSVKTQKQYMQDRYNAAVSAEPILKELGIDWSAGAEVRMEYGLFEEDLAPLRYIDTPYLLLEWPFTQYPIWGEDIVYGLLDRDIRPLFAHIERYDYYWSKPEDLSEFIENGVLCQINAGALIHRNTRKQALRLIKENYVHVLSSDAHNMDKRPPRLKEAYDIVESELGRKVKEQLLSNADDLFHGRDIEAKKPGKKRFSFF